MSTNKKAMLSEADKTELLKKVEHAGRITLGFTDIDGIIRGKVIDFQKFKKALNSDLGFCNVVFAWDMHDKLYPAEIVTGWDEGYPDGALTLDLSTFRLQPWDNNIPFVLGDFRNDATLSQICPRSLLYRIYKKGRSLGFTTNASAEYEWVNFKTDVEYNPAKYKPITKGMFGYSLGRLAEKEGFVNDIWKSFEEFKIPLEGLHTETGPGTYEAAIRYTSAPEAGDRASLFKHGIKCLAKHHYFLASFMAKMSESLPGCGGHIHQSLSDESGINLFYDKEDDRNISELLKSYLAGILHCAPHILPMYAPTINSYKRLTGDWAATTLSWGYENRTTAIRVISAGTDGTRIETRLPGADANPYLAMAATVASGLYGIEHNLSLSQQPVAGSAYNNKDLPLLATSLQEAITKMEDSDIANELFGKHFVNHFIPTRKAECRQFEKAVTDWEIKRYREII